MKVKIILTFISTPPFDKSILWHWWRSHHFDWGLMAQVRDTYPYLVSLIIEEPGNGTPSPQWATQHHQVHGPVNENRKGWLMHGRLLGVGVRRMPTYHWRSLSWVTDWLSEYKFYCRPGNSLQIHFETVPINHAMIDAGGVEGDAGRSLNSTYQQQSPSDNDLRNGKVRKKRRQTCKSIPSNERRCSWWWRGGLGGGGGVGGGTVALIGRH